MKGGTIVIEASNAYRAVVKKALSDHPHIYLKYMYDSGDYFVFQFGKNNSKYGYERIYFIDKKTEEIFTKHFTTVAIEGEVKFDKPVDFSRFEKRDL